MAAGLRERITERPNDAGAAEPAIRRVTLEAKPNRTSTDTTVNHSQIVSFIRGTGESEFRRWRRIGADIQRVEKKFVAKPRDVAGSPSAAAAPSGRPTECATCRFYRDNIAPLP